MKIILFIFPGTFYPDRQQLTCPGVCVGSDQGDPVRDLVAKYQVSSFNRYKYG